MTTKPRLHHSLIFVATQLLKIFSSSVSTVYIFRVRWPVATPIQIFHRLGPAHTTQLCAVERISLLSSESGHHYFKKSWQAPHLWVNATFGDVGGRLGIFGVAISD